MPEWAHELAQRCADRGWLKNVVAALYVLASAYAAVVWLELRLAIPVVPITRDLCRVIDGCGWFMTQNCLQPLGYNQRTNVQSNYHASMPVC